MNRYGDNDDEKEIQDKEIPYFIVEQRFRYQEEIVGIKYDKVSYGDDTVSYEFAPREPAFPIHKDQRETEHKRPGQYMDEKFERFISY